MENMSIELKETLPLTVSATISIILRNSYDNKHRVLGFKKDCTFNCNYRPINLLYALSKVFGKIILSRLSMSTFHTIKYSWTNSSISALIIRLNHQILRVCDLIGTKPLTVFDRKVYCIKCPWLTAPFMFRLIVTDLKPYSFLPYFVFPQGRVLSPTLSTLFAPDLEITHAVSLRELPFETLKLYG